MIVKGTKTQPYARQQKSNMHSTVHWVAASLLCIWWNLAYVRQQNHDKYNTAHWVAMSLSIALVKSNNLAYLF